MIQFPLQCSNPPEIGLDPIFWSKPVFKEWWQQGIVDSPAFSYSECTVGACFPRGTRCLFLPIRCRDFTVTDTFCKDFCSFLTLNIVCPNLGLFLVCSWSYIRVPHQQRRGVMREDWWGQRGGVGTSLMVSSGDGSRGLGLEIKKRSRQKAQWKIEAPTVWDHATLRPDI